MPKQKSNDHHKNEYDSQDEEELADPENKITIKPDDGELLVIQRFLITHPYIKEQAPRENLFHSRCPIKNKVCHLIIDSGS